MTTELTHYEDRALAATVEARKAACEQISKFWESLQDRARGITRERISCANDMREIGALLHTASGRGRLDFGPEGVRFYQTWLVSLLPKDFGIKSARACCKVANLAPEPIKTEAQLNALQKLAQAELELAGVLERHEVKQRNTPQITSPTGDAINLLIRDRIRIEEILERKPLSQWDEDSKDDALRALQPYIDLEKKIRESRA